MAKFMAEPEFGSRRTRSVCDDKDCLMDALNEMQGHVVIRNVQEREGSYLCPCGERASFYIRETSRRS